MNDVTNLTPGDRVKLTLDLEVARTFDATYLGHTDDVFTVRVGAMTVERTYRWSDPNAWIADPRTAVAYALPEPDDTLESVTPDLE